MYTVSRYEGGRNDEIAALILSIQNDEAGLDLTIADQPDLIDVLSSYREGGFWIADHAGRVVGTIGLLPYGPRAALKKFFVAKEHRGAEGPARALFGSLLNFAINEGFTDIFLDTPSVAVRSHAFYEREGFKLSDREVLPPNYEFPDRSSLVFRRVL